MCLQATKLEWITRVIVLSIWSCPYVDWLYLGSESASGGILLMWDRWLWKRWRKRWGIFQFHASFKMLVTNLSALL